MLGVNAAVGLGILLPNEDMLGALRVVVLSHNWWKQRFNADPNVISVTLMVLDERTYTIIGMMPTAFCFPYQDIQLWTRFPTKAADAAAARISSIASHASVRHDRSGASGTRCDRRKDSRCRFRN